MLRIVFIEDNVSLRTAMRQGLENTGKIDILFEDDNGTQVLEQNFDAPPDAALLDVALAGDMNGIQTAVHLRREYPRLPVVFYSIQDADAYYRDFLNSGILTHYAYVRKSNYLLPENVLPLIEDAVRGRSFIDPEIAARVQEVRLKDENDPLALLEPNEKAVVALLAQGLTNDQIAEKLGYRDARAVSRTNGQIYTAWGLNRTSRDEKVARTRAVMIYLRGEMILWDEGGFPKVCDASGHWEPFDEG